MSFFVAELLTGFSLPNDPTLLMLEIGLLVITLLLLASNADALRNALRSRGLLPTLTLTEIASRRQSLTLDSSFRESKEWWDSLSPPFHEEELEDLTIQAEITHFLFLIHGHRGFSRDLSYLKSVMQKFANQETRKTLQGLPGSPKQEMVVHSIVSNERKTTDGIVSGGERAVEEMLSIIRTEMEQRQSEKDVKSITISILGNSLGGMYGRYAITKLSEMCQQRDGTLILDDRHCIEMNVFCTTATPHLGVASHTFLPIPRQAEIGVAHAMGETGRDLFRLNTLLKEMATKEEYLKSLRMFRKRIAYANAYGTDFPVPAHTAAFLSASSTYPHRFVPTASDDESLIVASVETNPATALVEDFYNDEDDLSVMSASLDALGWKKVFIDVRTEIPTISLPSMRKMLRRRSNTSSESDGSDSDENGSAPINDDTEEERRVEEALHSLRQRGDTVSSRDVAAAVSAPPFKEKIYWPSGHNMIVAFSRSRLSTYLNRAGRPVVDSLAKELVADIFNWNPEEETNK